MKALVEDITKLHASGAYHIKRGFRLNELPIQIAGNHLIEEAAELQAELLTKNYDKKLVTEEASDVLTLLLRILVAADIKLPAVVREARKKLKSRFTTDPKKAAKFVSFTRKPQ